MARARALVAATGSVTLPLLMNKVSLFHPGADRALRRFRGTDAPVTRSEDAHLYVSGDARPKTGLREGDVTHAEVNEVVRVCDMSVIFGQQTRLRNGVLLPDRRLPRFHAGHRQVLLSRCSTSWCAACKTVSERT